MDRVRKELSRKRHGKDGYFYYALGSPYVMFWFWCSSARVGLWRSLPPVCLENINREYHSHHSLTPQRKSTRTRTLEHRYSNRIIARSQVNVRCPWYIKLELKDQVQHEMFFKYHLSRGENATRSFALKFAFWTFTIFSMNPKSRVIAKVPCLFMPIYGIQRKSGVRSITIHIYITSLNELQHRYNLETQNLSTLVHERWLDNFAMDCWQT